MPSKRNQENLSQLTTILGQFGDFFVTENKGLSVAEISSLRKELKETGSQYKIVKNRLFKIALQNKNIEGLDSFLKQSSGVVFVKDPIKDARALGNFMKTTDKLSVKGGYSEGKIIDIEYINMLSTLSSKEELVSKLMMILKNPVQKLAIVLDMISKQKENEN